MFKIKENKPFPKDLLVSVLERNSSYELNNLKTGEKFNDIIVKLYKEVLGSDLYEKLSKNRPRTSGYFGSITINLPLIIDKNPKDIFFSKLVGTTYRISDYENNYLWLNLDQTTRATGYSCYSSVYLEDIFGLDLIRKYSDEFLEIFIEWSNKSKELREKMDLINSNDFFKEIYTWKELKRVYPDYYNLLESELRGEFNMVSDFLPSEMPDNIIYLPNDKERELNSKLNFILSKQKNGRKSI